LSDDYSFSNIKGPNSSLFENDTNPFRESQKNLNETPSKSSDLNQIKCKNILNKQDKSEISAMQNQNSNHDFNKNNNCYDMNYDKYLNNNYYLNNYNNNKINNQFYKEKKNNKSKHNNKQFDIKIFNLKNHVEITNEGFKYFNVNPIMDFLCSLRSNNELISFTLELLNESLVFFKFLSILFPLKRTLIIMVFNIWKILIFGIII